MSAGYASNAAQTEGSREVTLNERLNKVAEALLFHCDRIESVLSRVNGTPPTAARGQDKLAQIRPTNPLSGVVETLEITAKRLDELSVGVERIA